MSKPVWLIVAILLACTTSLAFGFEFQPMVFPSARTGALGGTHAALADDISVLMTNPGAYRAAPPQFSVAELTTHLTGPIFSLADMIFRIAGGTSATSLLNDPDIQKLLTSLYTGATINGPISLGYIGNGLGFGLFNATTATFSTRGTVPTVTAEIREDLVFVAGYAFRIPVPDRWNSTLDVGFSVKTFTRASIDWSESILSFFSLMTSPSANAFLGQPFNMDVGFGLDTGALYSWNSVVSVGLVARNIYAPVARSSWTSANSFSAGGTATKTYGYAPLDVSLGVVYTPQLAFLEDYVTSPKLMLDYTDIFDFWTHPDTQRNPLLHVGLGAEVVLLDVLALRGGFGDGYFSAGFGMDLTAVRFDLAMFGRELSTQPGLRPNYNLVISTLFRY
jgi:hypothetical protein